MTIITSLAVCVVGAVVHIVANGKPSELGRLAFACGLLAFLIKFSGTLHLSS